MLGRQKIRHHPLPECILVKCVGRGLCESKGKSGLAVRFKPALQSGHTALHPLCGGQK